MAEMADSKLELAVEVNVNKATAPIKSVNTGLSGMKHPASKAALGASVGIDGFTMDTSFAEDRDANL